MSARRQLLRGVFAAGFLAGEAWALAHFTYDPRRLVVPSPFRWALPRTWLEFWRLLKRSNPDQL